jgi:hypothetical protein
MSESAVPTNSIGTGAVASHELFPLGDPRKEVVLKRVMDILKQKNKRTKE